jgi:hypothetical protein
MVKFSWPFILICLTLSFMGLARIPSGSRARAVNNDGLAEISRVYASIDKSILDRNVRAFQAIMRSKLGRAFEYVGKMGEREEQSLTVKYAPVRFNRNQYTDMIGLGFENLKQVLRAHSDLTGWTRKGATILVQCSRHMVYLDANADQDRSVKGHWRQVWVTDTTQDTWQRFRRHWKLMKITSLGTSMKVNGKSVVQAH